MDDSNSWDCSVCTYRNSAEAFKCSMCDVRKGTSTRKPRINPEMVAKQVARQQEQIKQQALKSAVKDRKSIDKSGGFMKRIDDTNSNSSVASTCSSGRNSPVNSNCSNSLESSNNTTANSLSFFCHSIKSNNTASSSSKFNMPSSSRHVSVNLNNSANHSDDGDDDERYDDTGEIPDEKIQTSSRNISNKGGRKSFRVVAPKARLKNVDRNDVQVEEVTVNNVTVVITEFKPKRKNSVHHHLEHNSQKERGSTKENGSGSVRKSNQASISATNQEKRTLNNKGPSKKNINDDSIGSKKRLQSELNDHNHHHNVASSKRMATTNAD